MKDDFDDIDDLDDDPEHPAGDAGGGGSAGTEGAAAEGQGAEDDRVVQHEGESEDEKLDRRRKERKERRARAKQREEGLRRQLAETQNVLQQTTQRLEAVERRGQSADLAMVDTEMQKAANAYNFYKQQVDLSIKNPDSTGVSEAIDKMAEARERYRKLEALKAQAAQRPAPQAQQQQPDPRITSLSQQFLAKNSWYNPDPRSQDTDSRVLRGIDDAVMADGFHPSTQDYWDEVESRAKKYLPHRYMTPNNDGNGRKPPPVAGSGKDGGASGGRGSSYTLSPERVAAMKEAGLWNDSAKREAMIKRYREADKQGS